MAGHHEDFVVLINEYDDDDEELLGYVQKHERHPAADDSRLVQDILPHRAGIAPPLPPGKLFHAFFSHCREDEEWVRNLLDRLEAPENGFRCCIADRDFDLGVPVFENIGRSIQSSCKTVIVMSPDFLTSPWCSYEAQITMEQDIDLRRRLLVPIMLRQCAVPEFIRRLTYIDVDNQHFWARFSDALRDVEESAVDEGSLEPAGSRARFMAMPFHFNPNYHNGQLITSLNAYRCCSCQSELGNQFIPDELISRGVHMNPQDYHNISRQLARTHYLSCHCLCGSGACFAAPVILILIIFMFFVIFDILYTYLPPPLYVDPLRGFIWWLYAAGPTLLLILIIGVMVCTCKIQAVRRYSKLLRDANSTTYQRNILVCSEDHSCWGCQANRVTICFYYYEWRSCELFIADLLQEREEFTEQSEFQEVARNLLLDHSLEYGQLLVRRRLATPGEQRHNRQGECMCQFVERTLQEPMGNRCLTRMQNTPSRHPWRLLYLM